MRFAALSSITLLLLSTAACAVRDGDFTLVSNRNVQFENIADARRLQNPEVEEAADRRHWFLFIPLAGEPNLESAVDELLDERNADCLVDVTVDSWWWTILVYSQSGVTVRGRPINTHVPAPGVTPPVGLR